MDLTEDENVERMSSGQLYIPGKARLDELRTTARLWCREFNATDDSVTGVCPQREELMKGIWRSTQAFLTRWRFRFLRSVR